MSYTRREIQVRLRRGARRRLRAVLNVSTRCATLPLGGASTIRGGNNFSWTSRFRDIYLPITSARAW